MTHSGQESLTRKEIETELIALVQVRAQRHPGIVVQLVAAGRGRVVYPDRKCACKAPPGRIAFCYCFSENGARDGEQVRG